MPVVIGAKPDSGFDDPIGMLKDCHRRIESFLGILFQVCRRARGRALSGEERHAVESALRYFAQSGPRHNEDEEQSVFPRLRASGPSGTTEEVERLEAEHHEATAHHDEAALLYAKWIANGSLGDEDENRLLLRTGQLQSLYEEHIRIEEEVVFPRAAALFNQQTLGEIGGEFKARRNT
ncbi:MAG: hemerythrin domain-containing protein [Acidobacteriota bacterium]|nr:hemerythrin domain-containing protein [Acidobacteriota bacterium]